MLYNNFVGDPFADDAIIDDSLIHVQSAHYSGPYPNLKCPATPNYPFQNPTRYFIYVPLVPYLINLSGKPFILKDMTTTTVLSKVTGAPSVNQYRIAPETSKTPTCIELHQAQSNHDIAFDYFGTGSIIVEENMMTILNTLALKAQDDLVVHLSGNETIQGTKTCNHIKSSVINGSPVTVLSLNHASQYSSEVIIKKPVSGELKIYFYYEATAIRKFSYLEKKCGTIWRYRPYDVDRHNIDPVFPPEGSGAYFYRAVSLNPGIYRLRADCYGSTFNTINSHYIIHDIFGATDLSKWNE